MRLKFYAFITLALIACVAQATKPGVAAAPICKPDAGWDDAAPPQHVYGNTWYVGTCGLSAILIKSEQGLVLMDGDTENGPRLIEANIRKLGFRVADVRYLLNSHAHPDHAGGLAKLKRDSGAVMIARDAGADALEHGHGDRSDPQFLIAKPFAPVKNVRRIADGETLTLGKLVLTAHATPGHTPGGTSWSWDSCEDERCMHMVYADSVSAVSDDVYRFSDETQHPGYLASFRHSLETIAALPCDILMTPHPEASDLWARIGPQATLPLVDTEACRRYAATGGQNLDQRIAKEQAGK